MLASRSVCGGRQRRTTQRSIPIVVLVAAILLCLAQASVRSRAERPLVETTPALRSEGSS
jgi:hypothetical protein